MKYSEEVKKQYTHTASLSSAKIAELADKEIHDLKERITKYEQNLGSMSVYFHQHRPEKAEKELTRFISELDDLDK